MYVYIYIYHWTVYTSNSVGFDNREETFILYNNKNKIVLAEVSTDNPTYKDGINPKEILLNCLDYALIYDGEFIEEWKQAILHAMSIHRKATPRILDKEHK